MDILTSVKVVMCSPLSDRFFVGLFISICLIISKNCQTNLHVIWWKDSGLHHNQPEFGLDPGNLLSLFTLGFLTFSQIPEGILHRSG